MIDKLDKWIAQQKHNEWVNCIFPEIPVPRSFDYQQIADIPMISETLEISHIPETPLFITQSKLDRKIKEAIENEREACAKLCEDSGSVYGRYIGVFLARLIRERSDD